MRSEVELHLDGLKTAEMYRLERRFKRSIGELLSLNGRRMKDIGQQLGVTESCISKWRKRLGITN